MSVLLGRDGHTANSEKEKYHKNTPYFCSLRVQHARWGGGEMVGPPQKQPTPRIDPTATHDDSAHGEPMDLQFDADVAVRAGLQDGGGSQVFRPDLMQQCIVRDSGKRRHKRIVDAAINRHRSAGS